jgi:hypothetical protein
VGTTTRKIEDVVSVELSGLELQRLHGSVWEIVEEYKKGSGRCVSSLLSERQRIDRGYLVRTFHQFFDGTTVHVSMSETYVPDPNEQWSVVEDSPKGR